MTPSYLRSAAVQDLFVTRRACRAYGRVVCVNKEIGDSLVRLGADSERLAVLPAFLGAPAAGAVIPAPILEWARDRKPLLSTVLWFRPEYDFESLIEATIRLRHEFPRFGLMVAGDGEDQERIQAHLYGLGLGNSILLLGDIPHNLCLALVSRSDLFVRATLADGDAISVREALGLGVPVVASDAAPRPPGVISFKAGDPEALAAAAISALGRGGKRAGGMQDQPPHNRLGCLLKIYGQVHG
jgi:glycosyltransferase involved in cell wall biosynthesis